MNFHPSKCYVLRFYRIKNRIIYHYTMLGQTVKAVDHQPYLGITISETLNWKTHILDVKNKANKTLGCIKRNLHSCPERVKAQAYTSLVRPILEYGSTAWDRYRIIKNPGSNKYSDVLRVLLLTLIAELRARSAPAEHHG